MADPLMDPEFQVRAPDISHLIMEDGQPVDGSFSERQMRLLVDALYDSWEEGRPFTASANVGLFYGIHLPAIVPDVLLSLGVTHGPNVFEGDRSYLVWEYGKPP
ncbi:MAG: Uma2 family endonuclease, partial [Candidatus Xenobia bacterium]